MRRRLIAMAAALGLGLVACSEEEIAGRQIDILTYDKGNGAEMNVSGNGDFIVENDCLLVVSADGTKLVPRFPVGTVVVENNGTYTLHIDEESFELNQNLSGSMLELRQMHSTRCADEGSLGMISIYSITDSGPLKNAR